MPLIRWRKQDAEKLRDVVSRFNRKARRVERTHPELADIQPATVYVKDLEATLKQYGRKEFNRKIRQLENYLKKGAERRVTTDAGTQTTAWELSEAKKTIRYINTQKARRRRQLNPSKETGTLYTLADADTRPRKDRTESISPDDWDDYLARIEKQAFSFNEEISQSRYKENFLHAVEKALGKDDPFYRVVSDVDKKTLDRYYSTDPYLTIMNVYPMRDDPTVYEATMDRAALEWGRDSKERYLKEVASVYGEDSEAYRAAAGADYQALFRFQYEVGGIHRGYIRETGFSDEEFADILRRL